jgi:transcriptional regulator with XRE-family HTH domain
MKTPNPIDAKAGARLRMRRLTLGMSKTEVGEALDISYQQVQKYENGTNRIGAGGLQQLANLLGVTPGYFFEDVSPITGRICDSTQDKRQSQVADPLITSEGLQLSRAFAAVRDAKVRKRILNLIVSLARSENNPGARRRVVANPYTAVGP